MGGTKWCEYCRINLPYNKKDIQAHEETRMHLQNKQKSIKFERIKIQQQQKKQKQLKKQTALLSSANIPKAKKGSALERQVQEYRSEVMASGKAAIAQLIAQRTSGQFGAPIQFPEKQDLVLAQNFKKKKDSEDDSDDEDSAEFQMWRLDICEQTGQPCFINNLTQAKYYEQPKGCILNERQKQQWQNLKQISKEKVDVNVDNTVNISDWQEVPEEQDYFKVNQIQEESQQQEQREEDRFKRSHSSLYQQTMNNKKEVEVVPQISWKDELEEKINSNSIDANQVMGTVIAHQLKMCRNIKEKNQTLKTLIKGDIQIRKTAQDQKKQTFQQTESKPFVGFKPKKKIKTVKLTEQHDIY